jgi:hypothetical protein
MQEFCRTLNLMTKYAGATVAVAIYQASQSAYDVRYHILFSRPKNVLLI